MKKTLLIAVTLILNFQFSIFNSLRAQQQMPVPYGSFEQWEQHSGYTVNAFIMYLPVFDSYTTPMGWNHLAYPVNESISLGFTSITVNTAIPLVKASQETGSVPDGNSALKLETFMINDIVDGTMLNLASSYIDTTLTNTVIPSILSTGEVNIENFMPIMMDMMPNMGGTSMSTDSLLSMLSAFMTVDVNTLITGGIALGDFEPSRLTGSYKYHSAVGGDNGGVVMIGTHYNSTLGKRDVVGGGANITLVDRVDYDTFAVDYVSLHTLDASYEDVAPDSLIILLISSASMNRQQGSWLCLDNLNLWMDTVESFVPDTCAPVLGLSVTPAIREAQVTWHTDDAVEGFLLEYGETGFEQGMGNTVVLDDNTYLIEDLLPETAYDVYVRSLCDPTVIAEWSMVQFVTNPDTCARITSIVIDSSAVSFAADGQLNGYRATWQSSFDSNRWEIEYGEAGFQSGTGHSDIVESAYCIFTPLQPSTDYELRVRTICNNDVYGEWSSVLFRTATPEPEAIQNTKTDIQLTVSPNPANGKCLVTLGDNPEAELRLYSADGSLIQTINSTTSSILLNLPNPGIFLLQVTTPSGTTTRKIVNR